MSPRRSSSPLTRRPLLFACFALILIGTGCVNRERLGPNTPQPPATWELGPTREYAAPPTPNAVLEDSVSGLAYRFPEGGSGTISFARILNGPDAPFSGHGFRLTYNDSRPVQAMVDTAGAAHLMILGYGRVDGAFDDGITRPRWIAIPAVDTLDGKAAFLITLPFESPNKLGRPQGFDTYWISSIPRGASVSDSIMHQNLQVRSYRDDFLDTLLPSRRALVEAEMDGRLDLHREYDGNYYQGFWWRSLGSMGRLVHPCVHLRPSANAGNIAHEYGHYCTHALVGDDTWSTLEGQAPLWDTGHGIRDEVGRETLLEDYAYVIEYLMAGNVKGYDLLDPYVIWSGMTPLGKDYPGLEGFGAVMLASLARSTPQVRDLINGRLVDVPTVGYSWGQVFELYTRRATGVNALRAEIESALGSDADKLPAMLQRIGWRYSVRGRCLDAAGQPISGVLPSSVLRVGAKLYDGGSTTLTTGSDGRFSIVGEVFGGSSQIRGIKGPDTAMVAVRIDWTRPTDATVELGDLRLSFPPVITGLSPNHGTAGGAVTIEGRNFGASTGSVNFEGAVAAVTGWSDTAIHVTVPNGARTGPVVVLCAGQTSNGLPFTVEGLGRWVFERVEVGDFPFQSGTWLNFGDFEVHAGGFTQHCGYDNPNFAEPHFLDWETRVAGNWTQPPAELIPGETFSITLGIETTAVRADDPPDDSDNSVGWIWIDCWGNVSDTLRGTDQKTLSYVVRNVSAFPDIDRLAIWLFAGGYNTAGQVRRTYYYRFQQ